jgi:Zn-dependent protease
VVSGLPVTPTTQERPVMARYRPPGWSYLHLVDRVWVSVLSPAWPALFALLGWQCSRLMQALYADHPSPNRTGIAVFTALAVTGVLLHEAAHTVAVRLLGGTVLAFLIRGMSAAVVWDGLADRTKKRAVISVAGPVAQLLYGAIILAATAPGPQDISALAWCAAWLNIALAVLNLLPLPGADGTRIIEQFLPHRAQRCPPEPEQEL